MFYNIESIHKTNQLWIWERVSEWKKLIKHYSELLPAKQVREKFFNSYFYYRMCNEADKPTSEEWAAQKVGISYLSAWLLQPVNYEA